MIYIHFQGKPFDLTVIQIYAQTTDANEAEVDQFYEDLQDRMNTKRKCPFHDRGLEWKSRKSRDTWSIRQVWPSNTKWNRTKANRVLTREQTGHSKHPFPTQDMTLQVGITRWSTPKSDWWYSLQAKMETLYTVSENKTRSWLWLRSWTPCCHQCQWSCSVVSYSLWSHGL